MRGLVSSMRSLMCRESIEERTASLDTNTRTQLARQVQDESTVIVHDLEQVDTQIDEAQAALQELQQKRNFISTRVESYERKLQAQATRLQHAQERLDGGIVENVEDNQDERKPLRNDEETATADSDDEETATTCILSRDELERQQAKLLQDEAALDRVRSSQADMDAQVLELQRKIFILERKRQIILSKTRQCRDFLVAAAQQDQDGDTVHLYDDLEEGFDDEHDDDDDVAPYASTDSHVDVASEESVDVQDTEECARKRHAEESQTATVASDVASAEHKKSL